ncbi:MAG: type II secretion system protein GspJ [bacterium]
MKQYKNLFQLCKTKRASGMTLIEVIIALAIFAIISVFTVTSTNIGMSIKKKISGENDYYHSLRTVLRYLDRDISLAFHAYADTPLGYKNRTTAAKTNPLLSVYTPSSFFKGTRDKLFFTSTSHRRMYSDTNETETCKISYYIEQDGEDSSIENLVKRESTFIDDKIEESGAKYIIASGVESISFRYFSPKGVSDDGTWSEVWDSTTGDTINTFPMAVEVTIVMSDPAGNKEKKIKITEKIKLFNPNNIESTTTTTKTTTTTAATGA